MRTGAFLFVAVLIALVLAGCSIPTPAATVAPALVTPFAPPVVPSFTPTLAPSVTPSVPSTPTLSPSATPTRSPTATRIPFTPTVTAGEGCTGGDKVVALVIDPRLVNGIRAGLDQITRDLCSSGYSVVRRLSDFATPADLRAYLAQLYAQTKQKLDGAILIGNVPRPYQYVTSSGVRPTSEELISFQYYSDLDGTFGTSASYKSPGKRPFSFDLHTGNVNWEIWIGLLPMYKGDVSRTIDAINRYFVKNHAYRLGQSSLPRAFIQVSEHFKSTSPVSDTLTLNMMKSGQYTWGPFATASSSHIYFDSSTPALALAQGYNDLSAGIADFAVLEAHGSYRNSGRLTINWAEMNPVRTIFFWSDGCATGNLDYPDNFLTAVLYSPTSDVLIARGTTNDSGGMGNNQNGYFGGNVANALLAKSNFGDAILSHVNVPLVKPWADSREFHFATLVVLGDPTLRLR